MEEKKKTSCNVVIVIILMLMVLGLGGYITYDKVLSNNTNNSSNCGSNKNIEIEDAEQKDYDILEAEKLVSKYYISGFLADGTGHFENIGSAWVAYKNASVKESTCDSVYKNSKYKYEYGAYTISDIGFCDVDKNDKKNGISIISYDDLNKVYQELYGSKMVLKKEDIRAAVVDYDEKTNQFVQLSCHCGGMSNSFSIYGVKGAKTIGNKLFINVVFANIYENSESEDYITNFGKEEINIAYKEARSNTFKEDFISKYKDKMDLYKFTFEKENDHYILVSLENN